LSGRGKLTENPNPPAGRKRGEVSDGGFALVFALLLLGMMSLMALAMVLSSSSDMLINSYYRNARGAYYAADSGLNIARQQLMNQIQAQVPSAWSVPTNATLTTWASTVQSAVLSSWATSTSLNSGQAANSWSESFEIVNTTSCPTSFGLAAGTQPTITSHDSDNNPNGYRAVFNYQICSTGMAQGSEQTTVSESGSVTLNVSGTGSSNTYSFASYGAFIDQFTPCLGPLVPGYLTGPMFTNGAWQWGTTGTYTLTDFVGQQNADFDFWFGNNCIQSATSSYKSGSQTIAPQFQGSPSPGYALGQNQATLPANDYSQQWAALDGKGSGEGSGAPSATQMHNGNLSGAGGVPPYPPLQTASGTVYPSGGAGSGVYLPYTTSGSVNTFDGGGFYVEGNASVALSISGASAQVFTISQSNYSTTTTTTITTDPLAAPPTSWNCTAGTTGTTTVATKVGYGSTTTVNFCGVPMNLNTIPNQPGTIIYVDGDISASCSWGGNCTGGLSGPGEGQAGIQDHNAITIAANGEIDITGDLIYNTEPVTTSANQIVSGTNPACCNGSPADTLIPGHDNGQVLGIFTANGNIVFSSNYYDNNLEVDGSMVAIAQGQNWGFKTNGSINTLTNVGGRIENQAHTVNMNTFNIYFDRRFTHDPGFAPPWFPSTTITSNGPTTATAAPPTAQRVHWLLMNM